MSPDEPAGGTTLVEDLLVTGSFLVKGRVAGKSRRLSDLLQDYPHDFLPLEAAELVDLRSGAELRAPALHVNLEDLIFAHEFLDLAGDEARKALARERDLVRVAVITRGLVPFQIAGLVRSGALRGAGGRRGFLVMERPRIVAKGLPERAGMEVLQRLSYLILRKEAVGYWLEVGPGS